LDNIFKISTADILFKMVYLRRYIPLIKAQAVLAHIQPHLSHHHRRSLRPVNRNGMDPHTRIRIPPVS